ncbi:MAG: adenylate/guanylate cyclase domain-containing protein [Alphaproteobacteria bacterium]
MSNEKKLVLIVDDTPTNITVISGVLKDQYRTKVATNGEKALAIATGPERPDLILLDVMMPGMDGYEVCRRLKENPETADVPVIFLTAKTEEGDEELGFQVGAVDYIHKPFSAPVVLARVRTQLALQDALSEAQEAQAEADQLLHALLPKKAADEIRSIGTVIPRRYENVAVLFCDVTNFTAYCDKHEPEEVISRLDALFVIFERVAAKHGLEKIKTIGDGFMAAAGLLHKVDDPVGAAVRCGLEMASTLTDAHLGWEVRVGVHAGPVVAGVVGQERYQFDIWGDTVNMAARMMGLVAPGSVVAAEEIWNQVSSDFHGEPLGELEVKGKGRVVVYSLRQTKH